MELSLTMNDGLAQLLALFYHPCRIFLTHLEQGDHEFLHILGISSTDSTRILGIGILDEVETPLTVLAIERVAGLDILELHGTADVASLETVYSDTVGTGAGIDGTQTLLGTTVGIGKVVTRLNRTTHNLEVRHFTDMGFHTSLEEIQTLWSSGVGLDLFTTGIVHLRHLAYEGNYIAQEFHQSANAHVLACAYAEYREDRAGYQTLADTFTQLVLGEGFLFEELLHQRLVVLGSSLDQSLVQLQSLVHLLGRNVLDDGRATLGLPAVLLHQEHGDKRIETRTGRQGVLYLYALAAIDFMHAVDDIFEVALV